MYIDEPLQVDLSAGGVPLSFRWRGISYAIVSAPEPWLSRRVWWRSNNRVTRGQTPPLDVPTWRVDAIAVTSGVALDDGVYDLAQHGDAWRLVGASTTELDQRLFA
jgi:hypothetical protein